MLALMLPWTTGSAAGSATSGKRLPPLSGRLLTCSRLSRVTSISTRCVRVGLDPVARDVVIVCASRLQPGFVVDACHQRARAHAHHAHNTQHHYLVGQAGHMRWEVLLGLPGREGDRDSSLRYFLDAFRASMRPGCFSPLCILCASKESSEKVRHAL